MKKVLAVALGLSLLASVATASNTGFKLNLDVSYNAGLSNLNFISLPYFYFPDGDVSNMSQFAKDVCTDLNDAAQQSAPIANIRRFNATSDTFTDKACATPVNGFPIDKGMGYALIPASSITNPTTLAIVGSHDDQYASNKTPATFTPISITFAAGLSNLNFLSIPYHWQPDPAQTSGPTDDAKGLCWTVNGNAAGGALVANIRRFNSSSDTFTDKACATPVGGFPVAPGQSYAFIPNSGAPQPVNISFTVY